LFRSRSWKRSPTLNRIHYGRLDRSSQVQGINRFVILPFRVGSENSWTARQDVTVSGELRGDVLSLEIPALDKDPIPRGPGDYGEIDDAEFLSKEIGPTDLVGEALEILEPFE